MIESFRVFTGTAKDVQKPVRSYLAAHPKAQVIGTAVSPGTPPPLPAITEGEPPKEKVQEAVEPIVAISVGIVTPS